MHRGPAAARQGTGPLRVWLLARRGAGVPDGERGRRDAAHRLGPVDHRMAADRRHRAAAVACRLAGGVRQVPADPAIPARQQGHEPRRVQGHLLVGMGASPPWPPDRRRSSSLPFLVFLVARADSARAAAAGSPASSRSAACRARSAGTWCAPASPTASTSANTGWPLHLGLAIADLRRAGLGGAVAR